MEEKEEIPRATEIFSEWAHKNFKEGEGVMIWAGEDVFICSRPKLEIYLRKQAKK